MTHARPHADTDADPTGPETVRSCPFRHDVALEPDPAMARLRTQAPITRIAMPYGQGDCWLVTRYADVRTVTSDRRFSRAALVGQDFPRTTPVPVVADGSINLMDPPVLNRVRRLVIGAFTIPAVEAVRPWVRTTVDGLLDAMADAVAERGRADLVSHLAHQIPLLTIYQLMEVPEEDRPRLRAWATAMTSMHPDGRAAAVGAEARLRAYFGALSLARRRRPGSDLISALATARIGDETLTEDELAVLTMLLVVTGHDTTAHAISNIVYTLLTHPDRLDELRARPGLLPQALEELLRFIPFRQGVGTPRVALEDVELGGVLIRAGDTVQVSYLTANRDGSVYDRPDGIDFERTESAPHMAFGYGSHHCLGSHLARMVLQVSVAALLHRFPGLRLATPAEEVRWNTGSLWRHPLELPLTW
ncbi:cytochrome P450 [Streptomyces sp. NPDC051555]|uniref:cytochrome P450 n=1 Tax=Streptomyces sp. NPDC051555 TaxID=3365657 RepID=UPI00378BCA4D